MRSENSISSYQRGGQPAQRGVSIHGITKRWLSWDPRRVTTAAALSYLVDPPPGEAWVLTMVDELDSIHGGTIYGSSDDVALSLWVPDDHDRLGEVALSVRQCRKKYPDRRRVVYLPPMVAHRPDSEHSAVYERSATAQQKLLLYEAGAQIIAGQLPFLLKSLLRLMVQPGNVTHGNHRFTRGLLDRLPWQQK
jgi:hypothetical protein